MNIVSSIAEMRSLSMAEKSGGKSIGFVPTMGALHDGHLTLVHQARQNNDVVVCSIFVNPIQFNNSTDLEKYPRTPEQDLFLLEQAGCDVVFIPTVDEMYPQPVTMVYDLGILDRVMEGLHRPGHFNGVAIVVSKLFGIVAPGKAYFGQKDYQQLAVIRKLVEIENHPVEIVACPTIREDDGLAMSSRNIRLTPGQREVAPVIYKTISEAASLYSFLSPEEVIRWVNKTLLPVPELELEYFEIADAITLQPLRGEKIARSVVMCIAVYMGQVRLIDNILINY